MRVRLQTNAAEIVRAVAKAERRSLNNAANSIIDRWDNGVGMPSRGQLGISGFYPSLVSVGRDGKLKANKTKK